MFSNPQTSPSRLWVEVDQGDGFTPLFVVGSERYTWHGDFFGHHRIRKLLGRIGRAGRGPEYNELGRWLAREAAREFPDAKTLRVSVTPGRRNHPTEPTTQCPNQNSDDPAARSHVGKPSTSASFANEVFLGRTRLTVTQSRHPA